MNFLSTVETAKKWHITDNRVNKLARGGKIKGAIQIGKRWLIPENAEKPIDGRTKTAKSITDKADYFRYPSFEYRDLASFNPPLSSEELQLKQAQEAFHRGEFADAEKLLPKNVKNKHLRIAVLHTECTISIYLCNSEKFFESYGKLCAEFQDDFPHKKEMQECLHMIDATLGSSRYFDSKFTVSAEYEYHDSYLPHLASLSAISLVYVKENLTLDILKAHEVNCRILEHSVAYVDLQALHIYLGSAYCYLNKFDDMTYHFKKALALTEKYELYYVPALQYYYLGDAFEDALADFPKDMKTRLKLVSDDMHKRYQSFMDMVSFSSIYMLLQNKDYMYLYNAIQGRTNKEIANILHVSESTVNNKFVEIYEILNVSNKAEMIELFIKSTNSSNLNKNSI